MKVRQCVSLSCLAWARGKSILSMPSCKYVPWSSCKSFSFTGSLFLPCIFCLDSNCDLTYTGCVALLPRDLFLPHFSSNSSQRKVYVIFQYYLRQKRSKPCGWLDTLLCHFSTVLPWASVSNLHGFICKIRQVFHRLFLKSTQNF